MKKIRIAFIVIILAACIIPSLLLICGFKNANRENRVLAGLPKLFSDGRLNTDFSGQFEDYFDDHFALREYMVTAFSKADVALLHDFNGTNAVIGKGEQIFYGETLDDYLGVDCMTPDQIRSIADYLFDVQTELASKGIVFAFITAPNKSTVYPELMPSYLMPTDEARNIDMLAGALEEKGVNYIDAKKGLLEAKAIRPVYYEHDSHWNNFGAMLVYNEIASRFGLEAYDPESFTTVRDRTGDLHNFVYPASDYLEERIVYDAQLGDYSSKRPVNFDRDKIVETSSEANSLSMVFYHDSFGRSLQPIISPSVGSLYMTSYFPYDLTVLEDNAPDFVLIELVERNLDRLYEHAASLGY